MQWDFKLSSKHVLLKKDLKISIPNYLLFSFLLSQYMSAPRQMKLFQSLQNQHFVNIGIALCDRGVEFLPFAYSFDISWNWQDLE